jgi:hypothetical protein
MWGSLSHGHGFTVQPVYSLNYKSCTIGSTPSNQISPENQQKRGLKKLLTNGIPLTIMRPHQIMHDLAGENDYGERAEAGARDASRTGLRAAEGTDH